MREARAAVLDVAFEDAQVLVAWKRAGVNTRAVEAVLPDGAAAHRPAVLYRLCKGVSGLLVAALTAEGARALVPPAAGAPTRRWPPRR